MVRFLASRNNKQNQKKRITDTIRFHMHSFDFLVINNRNFSGEQQNKKNKMNRK